MKLLTLDIERKPNLVYRWSLRDKNPVPLNMVKEFGSTISFAAKWYDNRRVEFFSDFHHGHEEMMIQTNRLLDEADAVCHYNGNSFDMKHLRKEMVTLGLRPFSPVHNIDLMRQVMSTMNFESYKLEHVARELGLGGKVQHAGFDLWRRCMDGDPKAWATMRRYNKYDVVLTEKVRDKLLPWLTGHPHMGLYAGLENACSNCGSQDLERRGFAYTAVSKYQRFVCNGCGKWSRGKTAIARVDERGTA